ncbi:hypothetical protein HS125_19480 [bacterium]|nr:hypothetical protein [bacterium]
MIIAGRVLRCREGLAEVLLIQTAGAKQEKGCHKCGGPVRCPIPRRLKVLHVPTGRPLEPGEDVEVEVWEGPSEYEGGHWGAELLVGVFAGLTGLGMAQIAAQRGWQVVLSPAVAFSLAALCGALGALFFEWNYRRRARLSRLRTRIL